MSLRRLKWAAGGVGALCLLLTGVFAVLVVILPLPERLRLRDSTVVHYDDGRPAHVFLGSDERYRLFVAPNDVDPRYVDALIRFEDKRFYAHHGVDFVAVMRAAWTNVTRGRVVSGASTLTMQVVRLLEPRPRTLRSKAVEAFRAVQLEFYLSKEEILAAYLRFVPLGGNLEGIGAASLAYFGHDVKSLSPAEIVTLLAVPQNPNRRQPKPQNRARLRGAVDTIAKRLTEAGVFTEDERKRITASALVQNLRGLPKNTPHLAFWAKSSRPKASAIRTTVRADVQSLAEQILAGHRSALARRGIHNAAVVVIDVEASAVRAVIGNFDFFDRAHAGQIPGFARRRSPGSALKPFLYGLGIDRGVVLPEHLVEDAPVRFGNYAPKNYDGRFRGVVRFSDALSASLNVPFVNLLRDVTVAQFVDFLQQGGVDVAEPDRYGLSLAIGGIELTPLEVTNLYAALARGGMYEDAALLHGTKSTPARPWLSPGAAFLTRRGLGEKGPTRFSTSTRARRIGAADLLENRHVVRPSRRLGGRGE